MEICRVHLLWEIQKSKKLLHKFNSFQGMALVEGHIKGVLCWGGHNLVNFLSLAHPLRLCVCTYLALSNWRFGLCVQNNYLFCVTPPTLTINMLPHKISSWSKEISTWIAYLLSILFKLFKLRIDLHSKFCERTGKMTFKTKFSITPI